MTGRESVPLCFLRAVPLTVSGAIIPNPKKFPPNCFFRGISVFIAENVKGLAKTGYTFSEKSIPFPVKNVPPAEAVKPSAP